MNTILKLVSFAGLALTVGPAFLVFAGSITWRTHAMLMFAGTLLWFITAPFWMHGDRPATGFWKRRRPV
jgi:hypothetical protein